MSKYKTRSEKLLNTVKTLQSKGRLSVGELREMIGSLTEARKIVQILVEVGMAESVFLKNDGTNRESEYVKYNPRFSLDSHDLEVISEYIIGPRESAKYAELLSFLGENTVGQGNLAGAFGRIFKGFWRNV
ncbi:MAG: hypothetical protein ABIH11_00695 [Candidatus Altiarchaeota archaeon]